MMNTISNFFLWLVVCRQFVLSLSGILDALCHPFFRRFRSNPIGRCRRKEGQTLKIKDMKIINCDDPMYQELYKNPFSFQFLFFFFSFRFPGIPTPSLKCESVTNERPKNQHLKMRLLGKT